MRVINNDTTPSYNHTAYPATISVSERILFIPLRILRNNHLPFLVPYLRHASKNRFLSLVPILPATSTHGGRVIIYEQFLLFLWRRNHAIA